MADCKHENFVADAKITRHTVSDTDDRIIAYSVDLKIECSQCHIPFEFIGLPMGYSPYHPMCSVDGLEARLPIKPQGEAMAMNLAGFSVERVA